MRQDVRVLIIAQNAYWRSDSLVLEIAEEVLEEITSCGVGEPTRDPALAASYMRTGAHCMEVTHGNHSHQLGVSASHEGFFTFVALAGERIAIDACLLSRFCEVIRVMPIVLTHGESSLLQSPWDVCRAWTAIECMKKLYGRAVLRSRTSAPLVCQENRLRLQFRGVEHYWVESPGSSRDTNVCIGVKTLSSDNTAQVIFC